MSIANGNYACRFFVPWCLCEKNGSNCMPRAERVACGQRFSAAWSPAGGEIFGFQFSVISIDTSSPPLFHTSITDH